jgi:hypothetical protein
MTDAPLRVEFGAGQVGRAPTSTVGEHWRLAITLSAGSALLALFRRASLKWGTTQAEAERILPGDDLLPDADLCATRAITINAPPETIWPWIAQLGQGRGGFYSYDFLENLIGCDIHSADRIIEQWQHIAVGDQIDLAPGVGLTVAIADPGGALVLRGGVPALTLRPPPYDFTWAFVLLPSKNSTTRLVVRERYTYSHSWVAALVEPVELISLVMSRRMMRGIRQRAEQDQTAPSTSRDEGPAKPGPVIGAPAHLAS